VAKGSAEIYRPAEACRIAEVAPYVLRYWETEFPALSEGKDKGAAKLYTARDVKIIARIRELLYDEGFTVAGAKKRLEAEIAEGRFDDGLAPAPPLVEQRGVEPRKAGGAPAPRPAPSAPQARPLAAPPRVATPVSKAAPAPAPVAKAPHPAAPDLDRRAVVRELKDIVRLLDRSRR
jgi:DNA-binding transcriptional MerR regulator